MGLQAGNYRYVIVWAIFSAVNALIVRKALETPMKSVTPRLVYAWYKHIYNAAYGVGVLGYVVVLLAFFHVPYVLGISMETEISFFEVIDSCLYSVTLLL